MALKIVFSMEPPGMLLWTYTIEDVSSFKNTYLGS